MTQPVPLKRRTWNARYPLVLSLMSVTLLAALIGLWAARANISGAVIGKGTVEVSQTMTALQHPIGGVVSEILVTNGDSVTAGDVVVRLEDAQLRSDLTVVEGNLFEVLANVARLEAIIDGRQEMDLHPAMVQAAAERPEFEALIQRQKRQLFAHFEALAAEARLLDEQITQVNAQIAGLGAQVTANRQEQAFVTAERKRLDELSQKGLMKASDLFALEKTQVSINGEYGRLTAGIAELRGKISELELNRHTIGPKEQKLAVAELSKLRPERTKYLENRAVLQDRLTKLEIRAPISGKVHDSQVQGLRSVVVAAKPLMMIVPDADPALVIVRIEATDIDQVYPGQEATLKFKAFNLRHLPIILGEVVQISADVFLDPLTRKNYYEVALELQEAEIDKLGDRGLLPGMPVEAFLATDTRTPLNYVLQPLMTYLDRAFRDA